MSVGIRMWGRGVVRDPGPALGLLVFVVIALFVRDSNIQNTITLSMVWAFWALSLNLIWGYAGQFSMAQVALGGVSAYTSTILTIQAGWPTVLSIAAGTVATIVVSLVVGIASLRLADFGFAIMTLAFALAGIGLATGLEITGQSAGLLVPNDWLVLNLGPLTWDWNDRNGGFSVLLILAFLLAALGVKLLLRTKSGRSMLAMREDVVLAESLGINPRRTRLVAFAISGFVASFAGVFQAHYYSYVYPTLFDFTTLVNVIVVLTLGGRGRLFGPLIGGVIYASLTNILHVGGAFEATVLGVAVILLTIFARQGVAYYIWRGQLEFGRWLRRRIRGSPGPARGRPRRGRVRFRGPDPGIRRLDRACRAHGFRSDARVARVAEGDRTDQAIRRSLGPGRVFVLDPGGGDCRLDRPEWRRKDYGLQRSVRIPEAE